MRHVAGAAQVMVAVLALAFGVLGCGGASVSAQRSNLETAINDQLPDQLEHLVPGLQATLAERATCVHTSGGRFDCVTKVREVGDAVGGRVTESVSIAGTCDDENCTWKTNR